MNLDLEQIKAAARAATPGPWEVFDGTMISDTAGAADELADACDSVHAAYIAAANPAAVLALVDRLERAERISPYAFWFTGVDEFDDLCPAEVLAGAGLSQRVEALTEAQRRHLELPPIERYKMIKAHVVRSGPDIIS